MALLCPGLSTPVPHVLDAGQFYCGDVSAAFYVEVVVVVQDAVVVGAVGQLCACPMAACFS